MRKILLSTCLFTVLAGGLMAQSRADIPFPPDPHKPTPPDVRLDIPFPPDPHKPTPPDVSSGSTLVVVDNMS